MRRRARLPEEIQNRGWLMSFNDLLTLLLAFFIMLVSLSSFHVTQIKDAAEAANKVFNQVGTEGAIDIKTAEALNRIEGVNARAEKKGIRVSLKENMLYEKGSSTLQDSATRTLHELAGILRGTGAMIRVEGHTDNREIHTEKFPSNWELSAARAVSVVKYLSDREGVSVSKMSAAGYADSRPMGDNETEAGRALNRRTEIILVWQEDPWQSGKR